MMNRDEKSVKYNPDLGKTAQLAYPKDRSTQIYKWIAMAYWSPDSGFK